MSDKVVDFSSLSKKIKEQESSEDYVDMGIEAFNENIQDAKAFLAITFSEDGEPSIVWAGDLDPFYALGALDVVKNLFMDKTFR